MAGKHTDAALALVHQSHQPLIFFFEKLRRLPIDRNEDMHRRVVPDRVPMLGRAGAVVAENVLALFHAHHEFRRKAHQGGSRQFQRFQTGVSKGDIGSGFRLFNHIGACAPIGGSRYLRGDRADKGPALVAIVNVQEQVARDRETEASVGTDDVALNIHQIQFFAHDTALSC